MILEIEGAPHREILEDDLFIDVLLNVAANRYFSLQPNVVPKINAAPNVVPQNVSYNVAASQPLPFDIINSYAGPNSNSNINSSHNTVNSIPNMNYVQNEPPPSYNYQHHYHHQPHFNRMNTPPLFNGDQNQIYNNLPPNYPPPNYHANHAPTNYSYYPPNIPIYSAPISPIPSNCNPNLNEQKPPSLRYPPNPASNNNHHPNNHSSSKGQNSNQTTIVVNNSNNINLNNVNNNTNHINNINNISNNNMNNGASNNIKEIPTQISESWFKLPPP